MHYIIGKWYGDSGRFNNPNIRLTRALGFVVEQKQRTAVAVNQTQFDLTLTPFFPILITYIIRLYLIVYILHSYLRYIESVPMFKLHYLRLRSRYMLFCFLTVFSFSILFVMFQNSLSRPAIETLVTETHKQINNFKNFKVSN